MGEPAGKASGCQYDRRQKAWKAVYPCLHAEVPAFRHAGMSVYAMRSTKRERSVERGLGAVEEEVPLARLAQILRERGKIVFQALGWLAFRRLQGVRKPATEKGGEVPCIS